MKSITHENRRRLTITTIISILVLAIGITTLVLLLKKDTTAPTNTIEVGKRIDTRLGGGRKLLNASVWDGSSATKWTKGSGTEADPYIIESAANLAYLRGSVNGWTSSATTYQGMYFLQTIDIDLAGATWQPIGYGTTYSFSGIFDGGGYSIFNVKLGRQNVNVGLFGRTLAATIRNVNVELTGVFSDVTTTPTHRGGGLIADAEDTTIDKCSSANFVMKYAGMYVGGLIGIADNCVITNCIVDSLQAIGNSSVANGITTGASGGSFGGAIGETLGSNTKIENVSVVNSSVYRLYNNYYVGGIVGRLQGGSIIDCYADIDIIVHTNNYLYLGGISGFTSGTCAIKQCAYIGTLDGNNQGMASGSKYVGGLVGTFLTSLEILECYVDCTMYFSGNIGGLFGSTLAESNNLIMSNNLVQGSIVSTGACGIFGILYRDYTDNVATITNNIINTYFDTTSSTSKAYSFGYLSGSGAPTTITNNFYNSENKSSVTKFDSTTGAKTSNELKTRSTYDATNWAEFDTYWIINEKINNGYPFLRAHINYAQVTGFDGDGTETDPFQVKTTADLQGMQAYYNDYEIIDEYWWILVNDLDISVDANKMPINWCPIGYEGGVTSGFNGHFDGNDRSISGLNITEQYANVGLFGSMASNATITNLDVSGTILWDQAINVGGIVGFMEEGAKVDNCTFTGAIIGYINSGNYAVVSGIVGKSSVDAITGGAKYDTYIYGQNNHCRFNRFNTTYEITPELIYSATDFLNIYNSGISYYKLANDINLNDLDLDTVFANYAQIISKFKGEINGGGHTITMPQTNKNANYAYVIYDFSGILKNVTLRYDDIRDCKITFCATSSLGVRFENITTEGSVSINVTGIDSYGPLIYTSPKDVVFKNCISNLDIQCPLTNGSAFIGAYISGTVLSKPIEGRDCGIVADVKLKYINCVNNGTIKMKNASFLQGNGYRAPELNNLEVSNCINNGSIIGSSTAGWFCSQYSGWSVDPWADWNAKAAQNIVNNGSLAIVK